MSKRNKKRNNKKKKKISGNITVKWAFWASIISAAIVASGTVYSTIKTTNNKIEYVESKTSEWEMEDAINYFPLKKGNSWSYEGVLTSISNGREKYSRPISMEIKVVEEVSNQDITLFGLSNYFEEFSFFQYSFVEKTNKEIIISQDMVGFLLIANEIYYVSSEDYESVKDELTRSGELVDREQVKVNIGELDILYRMPLFTGQRFGDLDQIARSDLSYFWFVNDENDMTTTENNKIVTLKEFELMKQGLGFHEKIYLRPYLGVTKFQFSDQRTDVELNLTSFKIS